MTIATNELRRLRKLIARHDASGSSGERANLLDQILQLKVWLESVGIDVIDLVLAPAS